MKKTALVLALLSLAGCSKQPEVKFDTLEDARSQARENGLTNARAYIRENPRLAGFDAVGHGDSSQSATCPQGDGWASLSAMKAEPELKDEKGNPVITKHKIKCSTVSANLGCYLEADFKAKPFASEEGKCNETLPFPLPKVVGTK